MVSFLLIFAVVTAATAVPAPQNSVFPNGRIVGGEPTVIETNPYQVSLRLSGRHNCGASIISANYVATAAHCVQYPANLLSVRAGSSFKNRGGSIHHVEEIIAHEKYGSNSLGIPTNDIALLRVTEPFEFDDTRQPIDLFEPNEKASAGSKAVISGWGETGGGSPAQLQTVTIPVITQELCNKAYEEFGGVPDGQICAAYYGEGGKDSCQGDSGGPMAINGHLAGIVSWGNGCAKPYFPGVYTEVAAYRKWINKHVEL